MNILDENVPIEVQRLLRDWHISSSRIGYDLGQKGIQDEDIIPLLHRLGHSTFFTLDPDFYRRHRCHANYLSRVARCAGT